MRTKNKDKELNHRHFIGLRLTDVELDLLDQGAACLSVSRSEYLRKLLLEKQIHHQIEVVADMNDLRKLVMNMEKSDRISIRSPSILTVVAVSLVL